MQNKPDSTKVPEVENPDTLSEAQLDTLRQRSIRRRQRARALRRKEQQKAADEERRDARKVLLVLQCPRVSTTLLAAPM